MRRSNDVAKSAFNVEVGHRVREARHSTGRSIARFSEDIGISPSMLQNIEQGDIACPFFTARNIAEIVDCTLDDLAPVTLEDVDR